MTKKTFLFNTSQSNLYENLVINKEIIPKSFIRTVPKRNTSIKIIDDSHSITRFFLKTKQKKKLTKKEIAILKKTNKKKIQNDKDENTLENEIFINGGEGQALKLDKQVLRHKRWNTLQIEIPLIPNPKSLNLANNYANKLSFFKKNNKVWSTILAPEKGGFTVRSFGILGFLSTKQAKIACSLEKNGTSKRHFDSGITRLKLKLAQRIPFVAKKIKWRFLRRNNWKLKKRKNWIKIKHERKQIKHAINLKNSLIQILKKKQKEETKTQEKKTIITEKLNILSKKEKEMKHAIKTYIFKIKKRRRAALKSPFVFYSSKLINILK